MQFSPKDIPIDAGIHYGVSMEDYIKIKACSRTMIKDLLISPLTGWTNSPFNPNQVREDSKDAMILGEAHHTRFLEGRDVFLERYAPEFEASLFPDAIGGGEGLRKRCKELGVSAGGTLGEMSSRIREKEVELQEEEFTPLLHFLQIDHNEKYKGKVQIPAKKMQQLEMAAQAVEADPELVQYLRGGKAEVTLLWRDPVHGVPMKARCDYLDLEKTRTWLEFKTFTNVTGLELGKAVASAVAGRKYGLQAITNLYGLQELKEPVERAIFLFQETGNVPNVVARQFNRIGIDHSENLYWSRALGDYTLGMHLFADYYGQFGEDPWNPPAHLLPFEDEDFPAWAR